MIDTLDCIIKQIQEEVNTMLTSHAGMSSNGDSAYDEENKKLELIFSKHMPIYIFY